MAVLCMDLGGTKLNLAIMKDNVLGDVHRFDVPSQLGKEAFTQFMLNLIEAHLTDEVYGVAIGVPGLVDSYQGKVLAMTNIPHWRDVPLAKLVKEKTGRKLVLHNDANCFVMGEFSHANLLNKKHIAGVTLGTGLGCGLVLNGQLYLGHQSGAGEIGSLPYKNAKLEHFTSGQFFQRFGGTGGQYALNALHGDRQAITCFNSFGKHLAAAIEVVILAYSPERIVLGGSVSQSFTLFENALFKELKKRLMLEQFEQLDLFKSTLTYAPLYGAYTLFIDRYPKRDGE
ncbi:ROK family transcriptional repressor [Pseudoalteromonas luteoviolacea B = ATCC 29581]|nr:ROK family transcriptional repressor [Pseudoalteromonas luteoviolacea B = ATCC 29581]